MAKFSLVHSRGPKRLRIFSSTTLLTGILIGSLVQYWSTGQVTWLTSTFRWAEHSVKTAWEDPDRAVERATQWTMGAVNRTITSFTEQLDQFSADFRPNIAHEGQTQSSAPAYELSGRVTRVVDGDTLDLLDAANRQHRIRLHGIDTPESGQPYGRAATRALADRVAGEGVGVDVKDTDRYGRTVGVVYLGGDNINTALVKAGYAWWYRKYAPFSDELRVAEAEARKAGRGLWADPNPVPPWDWRRGSR